MVGFNKSQSTVFIGISGTRGKTTSAHLLIHLLKTAGARVGYLTSIGNSVDGFEEKYDLTSNEISKKQFKKMLAKVKKNKPDFFIVEISSKNIKNNTYDKLEINAGVLTNIKSDSLEYYSGETHYKDTKMAFVSMIADQGMLLLNGEDPQTLGWVNEISNKIKKQVFCEWVTMRDVFNLQYYLDGMTFFVHNLGDVRTKLIGRFNIIYILLALTIAGKFVNNVEILLNGIQTFSQPPGRLDYFAKEPHYIIVDSAKHPDAMEEALFYLKNTKPDNARIITVFGSSPDNRFKGELGKVAAQHSDLVILSPQDPRAFSVASINNEIHASAERYGAILLERLHSTEELDMLDKSNIISRIEMVRNNNDVPFVSFDADHFSGRLDAIRFALEYAKPGDIIYIAGKGHETTLAFKDVDYEWSDYEALRMLISRIPVNFL